MMIDTFLDDLDTHQAAMLSSIARAAELLECDVAGVRACRHIEGDLADTLRSYQSFKHGEIFDPAITSGSPSREAAGRRLKQDCLAGGDGFRSHVRRWRAADLVAEWPNLQPAMLAMMRHLRDHVRAEGVQIRLLLADPSR